MVIYFFVGKLGYVSTINLLHCIQGVRILVFRSGQDFNGDKGVAGGLDEGRNIIFVRRFAVEKRVITFDVENEVSIKFFTELEAGG